MGMISIGCVAVIDDDRGVLLSIEAMLQGAGYEVAAYASAGAFLADHRRQPVCLILDHHMPEMTGLELAARLRADGVRAPVLLVTGKPPIDLAAKAAALGIASVLEKPLGAEDLLSFVATFAGPSPVPARRALR